MFTSLSHIHHTGVLVDSHGEHVSCEELGVPGPAQVQFVKGSAQQLVVPSQVRAARVLVAAATVQYRHKQHQQNHTGS